MACKEAPFLCKTLIKKALKSMLRSREEENSM